MALNKGWYIEKKTLQRQVCSTYTSWNSSNDFCGVKTFNKLIIWKKKWKNKSKERTTVIIEQEVKKKLS